MNWNEIRTGAALGLCMAAGVPDVCADAPKPNVIVMLIDDLGYSDIEPFGSTLNKTPELSRMAAEGMKLTSCYAAARSPGREMSCSQYWKEMADENWKQDICNPS
ncbi:MAG: sulfatase-like hydrolase/transferase [Verrucomicrobiota bacterium]|nr:sulfatase-like hydrolase/transferase [Verrucomicrobiota bacterium]